MLVLSGVANSQPLPSSPAPTTTPHPAALESMKPVLTLTGHRDNLYSVCYSPDGRLIVTTSDDHSLMVWDAATGRPLRTLQGHSQGVFGVAISRDGTQVASCSGERGSAEKPARPGEVKLWELDTGREQASLQGHAGIVYRVAFRCDGKQLATAGDDHVIKVWDIASRSEILALRGHTAPVYDVAFSSDGKQLISASGDYFNSKAAGEAKLWDATTGQEIRAFKGHHGPVYSAAFSPDGKQLATASGDRTVKLWDVATGKELTTLSGHTNAAYYVAFSPDGRCLASAGPDHTIRIWDLTLTAFPVAFSGDPKGLFSVAYSPDGKRLVTGGSDNTAKVWDVSALRAEGRTGPTVDTARQLEALWNDLAAEEPLKSYRAFWILAAAPKRTVPFLQEQLRSSVKEDPRTAGLIAQMDSDIFAVRQKAMEDLEKLGEGAERALREALKDPLSLEVQRRVEQLLSRINDRPVSTPEARRAMRTVQMLEHFGCPDSRQLLERLGRGGWGRAAGDEARAALVRLEKRPVGK
jgi:tricorn protease-like protein